MSTKHQFIDVKLPDSYSSEVVEAIGSEIISTIRKRTIKGKDKDGEKFADYSKAYTESVDFRAGGKSKGSVNLTLSGDMLASMELLELKKNKIRIGFEEGSDINARADGNIRGTYGQPKPIPGKARDFLGVTPEELAKILAKYPADDPEADLRAEAVLEAQAKIDERISKVKEEESAFKDMATNALIKFFTLRIGKK